jgi:DNA-binding NtrC family response regulator
MNNPVPVRLNASSPEHRATVSAGFEAWLEGYLLGEHPLIARARASILVAAREEWPVLITGETGTGKDMAAAAIHRGSRRRAKEPQVVAVGGLSETAWSVLFGHRKGAFTGSERDHAGVFRLAHDSTLILEDVTDLPLNIQPMLLRAIERGAFRPLGEDREAHADVRVISTTNIPLPGEVARGGFRGDLYQRLSVLQIGLPPLREHLEDLAIYVPHFLSRAATADRLPKAISADAMRVLERHSWPRNVRELEHVLYRASAEASGSQIRSADLEEILDEQGIVPERSKQTRPGRPLVTLGRDTVLRVLRESRGNKREAARKLGVAPGTLYRLVERYRITRKQLF